MSQISINKDNQNTGNRWINIKIKTMKEVKAFKCGYCSKIYESKSSSRSHQYKCYFNPRTKTAHLVLLIHLILGGLQKNSYHIQTSAFLGDIDVVKNGLKTRCSSYHDRKYREDKEIMDCVKSKFDPHITLNSYVEKYPHLIT